MSPWDRHLECIGNAITIKDEDRQRRTKDFDCIRDYIIGILCKYDSDFKKLFKGCSLFGSYSNNARICYAKEFDVHMKLSFPFSKYIEVEEDDDRPGFVNLNFSNVLEELENCNGHDDIYDLLQDELLDYNNSYMRRGNLQKWIRDTFVGALDGYGYYCRGAWGHTFKLIYSKRGLAHTIYACIEGTKYDISIDFVPAILFGQTEWMKVRNYHPFRYKCNQWYAVPKPTAGPKEGRCYAFMICNPKVEHDLLLGRQNLKVVFRLLKSLRNQYGMKRLKSYFITTIFLWEIEKQPDNFWYNPVGDLFIHMLGVLCDYLIEEDLPFFWNEDLNLFDILYDEEIENFCDQMCRLYNIFLTYPHQPNLSYERVLTNEHIKLLANAAPPIDNNVLRTPSAIIIITGEFNTNILLNLELNHYWHVLVSNAADNQPI